MELSLYEIIENGETFYVYGKEILVNAKEKLEILTECKGYLKILTVFHLSK